jgi:hypothetical protein
VSAARRIARLILDCGLADDGMAHRSMRVIQPLKFLQCAVARQPCHHAEKHYWTRERRRCTSTASTITASAPATMRTIVDVSMGVSFLLIG